MPVVGERLGGMGIFFRSRDTRLDSIVAIKILRTHFYLSAEGKMMPVAVKADSTFEAGVPTALFQTDIRQAISGVEPVSYDVSADGKRFLVNTKVDDPNAAPLFIILNWAGELQNQPAVQTYDA